jgi:hypothetical protein
MARLMCPSMIRTPPYRVARRWPRNRSASQPPGSDVIYTSET